MKNFNNKLCVSGERISLYYATMDDKKLIFDMSMEPEIADIMFGGECEPHKWEDYKDEENEFYTGGPNRDNYLLIVYKGEIIGSVSHSYNDAKITNMELDIWFGSLDFTGQGLGVETLNLLMDYLYDTYDVKNFLIRPWIKNPHAIKAYEKCGFKVIDDFTPSDYYGDDALEWGDGDYGVEETVNMVRTVK